MTSSILGMLPKSKPVINLTHMQNNVDFYAVLSKLNQSHNQRRVYDHKGNIAIDTTNINDIQAQSAKIALDSEDVKTFKALLPDIKLAEEIFVSAITSPNDMVTEEINHYINNDFLPAPTIAAIIHLIRDHFEKNQKLPAQINKILRECLFGTGAEAYAIIPESTLDNIIHNATHTDVGVKKNITLENFTSSKISNNTFSNVGILGSLSIKKNNTGKEKTQYEKSLEARAMYAGQTPDSRYMLTISLEEIVDTSILNEQFTIKTTDISPITFSDNINILALPETRKRVSSIEQKQIINNLFCNYNIGNESKEINNFSNNDGVISDRELINRMYVKRKQKYEQISSLKSPDQINRKSLGAPLEIKLPPESVIPVFVPGFPEKHIGYFLVIDPEGYPVSKDKKLNYFNEFGRILSPTNQATMNQENNARAFSLFNGREDLIRRSATHTLNSFIDILEKNMLDSFKNGLVGDNVKITRKEEIYTIMLARSLANQQTQLLYVPRELMAYFAHDYHPDGTGCSLLYDQKIILSLRTMLMYADTMGSIKNSIADSLYNVKLDPDDPDPSVAIEIAQTEVMRGRSAYFPAGISDPSTQITYLQNAGMRFGYSGHDAIPDVSFDVSQTTTNFPGTDKDLNDRLFKQSIMGMGVPPDVIDKMHEMELATSVVTSNLLLSKRAVKCQDIFAPQISEFLKLRMYYDPNITKKMFDIVHPLKKHFNHPTRLKALKSTLKNNELEIKDDNWNDICIDIVNVIIDSYYMEFPKPNSATLKAQMTELEEYEKAVDKTLDYILGEYLSENSIGLQLQQEVAAIKDSTKSYFMRDYMVKRGILPEVFDLMNTNSDGTAKLDIYRSQHDHLKSISRTLYSYLIANTSVIKMNDKIAKILEDLKPTTDDNSDSSTTDTTNEDDTNNETSETPSDNNGDGMDMDFDSLFGTDNDTSDDKTKDKKDDKTEDKKNLNEEEPESDTTEEKPEDKKDLPTEDKKE